MDEINEVENDIKPFIIEKYSIIEENLFVKTIQIDGMTNKNYHIIFYDIKNPDKKFDLLFRKYGEVLDSTDHEPELNIMEFLSSKNEGPKVLYSSENYRIVEYINNSSIIPLELRYDKKILNEVSIILGKYSLISNILKYTISSDLQFEYEYSTDKDNKEEKYIFPTIFDIYEKMLIKAKEKYNIFNKKFNDHFNKNELTENIKNMKNKFDNYMNNHRKIFMSLFPKKGLFVLCHNDCQRWNFLFRNNETNLMIIDHEYASMCLPGLDLCNYMNENSYYFYDDGKYECKKDEINFGFYYEQYLKYYDEFINLNKDRINVEENKEFLDAIKTKKYYINLHSINNIFWFLFCVINLDFENEFIKKTDHYFQYGYDRISYSELAQRTIESYENKN
jgi:thiamine kinase-like enzyme